MHFMVIFAFPQDSIEFSQSEADFLETDPILIPIAEEIRTPRLILKAPLAGDGPAFFEETALIH